MDSSKVMSLLEALDDEIDDLEESLEPLFKTALSESASKLPLLDKAKLYVLVTYAIESMLFSYLRLHGINARAHPVFKELTRVKQYFDKIKAVETPVERTMAAGNDKYDLAKAEQIAKENAKAHIKFKDLPKAVEKKRNAGQLEASDHEDSDSSDSESSPEDLEAVTRPAGLKKKQSLNMSESKLSSGASTPAPALKSNESKKPRLTKKEKNAKKRAKKNEKEKKSAEMAGEGEKR
ncbi:hypothetical protein QTJ16_000514 [Diplocarpon rosae]|uniref:Exosome complex protein n=1 Tax=Diplocarpon rosae TaxID=946125 RepID=A0AAD9T6V3_9HELO|nr:hypothetical protein QTJ16_000514 [Diplocarpon rosae]PBP15949.1 hypothetical protein BUE80_DR013317 [Diplocarpon rosae]